MIVFRIADRRRPGLDGVGAYLKGGRWNLPGRRVVYTADSYSLALLEVLVHASRDAVPKNQVVIKIEIPDELALETLQPPYVSGWKSYEPVASCSFGDAWLEEGRTAFLKVPSVVVQGRQWNVLLNPEHADFAKILVTAPEEIEWDPRLLPGGF
ncbi:RES domain-containing protein [Granulicella pectinivorans]|uniref:RES domain-containing protein n=1 Tax=Granulicella pectinivorans TaxID=474950 RepID=A0A1I6LK94_9BACT|nr:RES domain-containing protein [Granulicella pectinivorans]SFS03925.1 RES domain-containing protein [Granulicella pectinivorans]